MRSNGQATRAVIYCRQSRDSTGTGTAVARQEEACRGLATARGWTVTGVYVDNDISASTGKVRPAWQQVLGLVESGETDVVIAWHLDRITRTMRDLEQLIELTQRHGVGVATATGDIDLTTDTGRMVARILAAVARQEVERKGERQILANQQRVATGRNRWSHRPFGYEKDGTHREVEAELLRAAYEDVSQGTRLARIRDRWNQSGVTTASGMAWTTQGLGKLIRDPRNCGVIRYQGQPAGRGDWAPIVSDELFGVAAAKLRSHPFRRGGSTGNPDAWLIGVAVCGECDGRIWTSTKKGVVFYGCQQGHVHLPLEWTEGKVLLRLSEILDSEEHRGRWEAMVAQATEEGDNLRAEQLMLLERLDSLAEDYGSGLLTREQMIKATAAAREKLSKVETSLEKLSASDRPVFDLETFAAVVDEMPVDQVRALLGSTVTIRLHRRGKGSKEGLTKRLVEVTPKA